VALAGLNHKCGWRGTTNTLLNFGEGKYPVRGQADDLVRVPGLAGSSLPNFDPENQCEFDGRLRVPFS